jgi:GPH family glycoside/pentoside/hexuronide:cation symporter
MMMMYTAINIPYTALLGVISADSNERTTISSFKFLFAFGAGIIVSATLLPMVKTFGAEHEARGWQFSFIVYGIAAIIFFLIAFKGTRERVQPPKSQKASIKQDLFELVTNKPWLILLATTITFILFVAVRGSVTVHYFKYFVGTQALSLPFLGSDTYDFNTLTSAYNTVGQISSFIGVLFVSWFAKLIGKKKAFIVIFIIAILSTGANYLLSAGQLGWLFFLQITGSMTGGPLSVLIWAMYADSADYGEWKRGRRTTGLIFSASTMSQKFGWAIGAYVALTLMSQVGFEPNQQQTADSLNGLVMLFSIIPAAFGVLAILILLAYPISDKRIAEISVELEERRKASGEQVIVT